MTAITVPDHQSPPIETSDLCAICLNGCDLREALLCLLRLERELRYDLKIACGHPDCEVLAIDLKAAERQVDALLAIAQEARR